MATTQCNVDLYVYLTCTAHGKPIWRATAESETSRADLPDRGVRNPPPVRQLGPYLVGPSGYASVEDAVAEDPAIAVNLDDSDTWAEGGAVDWIEAYLAGLDDVWNSRCVRCSRRLAPFCANRTHDDDLITCCECAPHDECEEA